MILPRIREFPNNSRFSQDLEIFPRIGGFPNNSRFSQDLEIFPRIGGFPNNSRFSQDLEIFPRIGGFPNNWEFSTLTDRPPRGFKPAPCSRLVKETSAPGPAASTLRSGPKSSDAFVNLLFSLRSRVGLELYFLVVMSALTYKPASNGCLKLILPSSG